MFTTNPFAELAAAIPGGIVQTYVIAMVLLVVGGTIFDVVHKGSARYFFDNWRRTQSRGARPVGGGRIAALAVQTLAVDVLTSAEFCNRNRRIAHLLTMYGFVIYLVATLALVFGGAAVPGLWIFLWYAGALLACGGGYWFWFFIRVDVLAEGHSPFRLVRADLFILSLLASVTCGVLWGMAQSMGGGALAVVFLILYVAASTVLFGSVPWSKFAHMFFKPAAALQKRVEKANGTRRNLPAPVDKPATFGNPRRMPQNF